MFQTGRVSSGIFLVFLIVQYVAASEGPWTSLTHRKEVNLNMNELRQHDVKPEFAGEDPFIHTEVL
jgi:hypothetical protein